MKYLLLPAALFVLVGCGPRGTSKADVDAAAAQDDPAKLVLETKEEGHRWALLPSKIQTGILTLGDGEQVKYWFKSRHLGNDLGHTRFQYGDGSVGHLEGYFCCEVEVPKERLGNREALKKFIAAHDGEEP
ncbi:hypothetical protein [Luteolibacter soli]|uniref:Lipoprotein n=1 Tax=Luteolibacter soli TaxID=3135280 RepID=A0ABU9AVR1_9BACT